MPPARRKGYTYLEQPAEGTAEATWALIRDADGQGLGAFVTNPQLYAAVDADRERLVEQPLDVEFVRTHLDEKGPDLRLQEEPATAPDGCRRDAPRTR